MTEETEPLSAEAVHLVNSAESRVTEAALLALLQASSRLDRFSNWLLAAAGAALALIMSNVESLTAWTSTTRLETAVVVLLVSTAVGALQKWLALVLDTHLAARGQFFATFPPLITSSDPQFQRLPVAEREPALKLLTERLKAAAATYRHKAPWYIRLLYRLGPKGKVPDLHSAVGVQSAQGLCTVVQLLTLVVAAGIALLA